ncbi:MAG: Kef-type K+ transport system membrane component KefB [Pseudomonadales bacterium]|jgi:Kef-type K+ transport system membrane component KefB
MEDTSFTFAFFVIFSGAAVLATIALYTRQPLIIAYIFLGAIVGPFGLEWIDDLSLLTDISKTGILFLLFLLGLDMQPQALLTVIRKATLVTVLSCLIFALAGYGIALSFGFTQTESIIVGAAMMFSSTIIGIKLLPTTVLHHKHVGELMVGILLLQDLIAIFVLVALLSGDGGELNFGAFGSAIVSLPILVLVAFGMVEYLILPLIGKFDRFHEYIFLLAIGWCLGMAELAHFMGLSGEIGAFLAGIALATSPISQYIATSLRPLRDFFLVLFFFALGAGFDLTLISSIWLPAVVMSMVLLGLKPIVFRLLLRRMSETNGLAWDVGCRLGQIGEFSLLVAYLAVTQGLLGKDASHLIQATAIITLLVSSYIVILNYPNPIAISDKLRRD